MDGKTSLQEEGHVHIFPESSNTKDSVTNIVMKVCSCGLKMPKDAVEEM